MIWPVGQFSDAAYLERCNMLGTTVNATVFEPPTLVFTVHGGGTNNPRSREVIKYINEGLADGWKGVLARVFDTVEEVEACFLDGHAPDTSVVFFDANIGKQFGHAARGRSGGLNIPSWARGAVWGVAVSDKIYSERIRNCAEQTRANFGKNFDRRVVAGNFPWGLRKKGEPPSTRVELPPSWRETVNRLNDGPDMVEAIADLELRKRIPNGARISWLRVPADMARFPRAVMDETLTAVSDFERASSAILRLRPELAEAILAGVHLPDVPGLSDAYLYPHTGDSEVSEWSVRRPDMHVCGGSLRASENDEMPGGFTDLVHIDGAYRINEDAWRWCFDWLCDKGPLVFAVSDNWSQGYISGIRWLADLMRNMGYETGVVTPADAHRLDIRDNEVIFDGKRIGTIWRQFPIFETTGAFADLVLASQRGAVRMVPEFAHFGNKTWFSLFWQEHDAFRAALSEESFRILCDLIPPSHLVRFSDADFPFRIGNIEVRSLDDLVNMKASAREDLVLKVTGANDLAARSYGVFVGHAHKESDWREWLLDRIRGRMPFIVQQRFETSVETLAVHNMATNAPEVFRCRVLMRPWMVGGRLISTHTCATPHYTTKVHGMVDMAIQPIEFV